MQFYLINIFPKLHHRSWQNYASHCLVNMPTDPNFLNFTIKLMVLMLFFVQPNPEIVL